MFYFYFYFILFSKERESKGSSRSLHTLIHVKSPMQNSIPWPWEMTWAKIKSQTFKWLSQLCTPSLLVVVFILVVSPPQIVFIGLYLSFSSELFINHQLKTYPSSWVNAVKLVHFVKAEKYNKRTWAVTLGRPSLKLGSSLAQTLVTWELGNFLILFRSQCSYL